MNINSDLLGQVSEQQETTSTKQLSLAFHWGFQAGTFLHQCFVRPTTSPEVSPVWSEDQDPALSIRMVWNTCDDQRQQQIHLKIDLDKISRISVLVQFDS